MVDGVDSFGLYRVFLDELIFLLQFSVSSMLELSILLISILISGRMKKLHHHLIL